MSYNVTFKENVDHLRVGISGKRTPGNEVEDSLKAWSKVAEICRERNINHILAILKISGHLPDMASYNIGDLAEKYGWSRGFKLAVVTKDEYSRKVNLLSETVAVNRGFDVKVFDNEQDAKTWLLES